MSSLRMIKTVIATTVIKGLGLAKKLGAPTMNCSLRTVPKRFAFGVYAAKVHTRFGLFTGVVYYGPRFFHKESLVFEIHCFGFKKNMYRKRVVIEIIKKLRGVKQFKTEASLKKQITHDIKGAKEIL